MEKLAKMTNKMGGELKALLRKAGFCIAALLAVLVAQGGSESRDSSGDSFSIPRAEFAKYYREITGKTAPDGMVEFAIDPKVSKSGNDAYTIISVGSRVPRDRVTITGSNLRSVLYGVYDLLARRGGCRWFWDGDIVPKKESLDFSNLNIYEESRFEYRGLRYFAHRGLTRFQAEHWGFDDWKREIDWMLKRRLNLFMLRIGQDDLFQKAFPDVCPYPDPSKPIPEAMSGYDNRSLFWSLQFRGELRKKVMDYAFACGLMAPEDFGTMSHWYSRTPKAFLEKMNPPFLPQQGGCYGDPTDRVWDIRDPKWLDAYWRLTETSIANYGKPDLLHTIGIAERHCFTNRADNLKMKCDMLNRLVQNAAAHYPKSKVLFAGWDFYLTWRPDEVKQLVKTLDPNRILIWDYEADAINKTNFTEWDVIGKFPYTFGIFLCYEAGLDIRANYDLIHERQKLVEKDPMCKGYILWPESSHTDTLCLRYFTTNAWSQKLLPSDRILDEFCESRYGATMANEMKSIWKKVIPASASQGWRGNYGRQITLGWKGVSQLEKALTSQFRQWKDKVEPVKHVFRELAGIPWNGGFIRRDTIDLARTALDRIILLRLNELVFDIGEWRKGKRDGADLPGRARHLSTLTDLMADVLELHTDYSLWESYCRLEAVEKVQNPDFTKTLFDNASCDYCRSHQYELARYWYAARMRKAASRLAKAVASHECHAVLFDNSEDERQALMGKPLESLRPTRPRTETNFRTTMQSIADALEREMMQF